MARVRNKEYNTVHHLMSRIAHRVFFLKEEERNDFVSLMMRVSALIQLNADTLLEFTHFLSDEVRLTPINKG